MVKGKKVKTEKGYLVNEVIQHVAYLGLKATPRQLRHWESIGIYKLSKDESGYRRFTSEDIEKVILVLGFKTLGFGLHRIRDILLLMQPKEKLVDFLKKKPHAFISKERSKQGEEEWFPKREIMIRIRGIKETISRTKAGFEKFEEIFSDAETNFYKAMMEIRGQI